MAETQRRKKTARERREQQHRSDARLLGRTLKAAQALAHRGSAPTQALMAFNDANSISVGHSSGTASSSSLIPQAVPFQPSPAQALIQLAAARKEIANLQSELARLRMERAVPSSAPVLSPQPKCWHGTGCKYFQLGTCRYDHSDSMPLQQAPERTMTSANVTTPCVGTSGMEPPEIHLGPPTLVDPTPATGDATCVHRPLSATDPAVVALVTNRRALVGSLAALTYRNGQPIPKAEFTAEQRQQVKQLVDQINHNLAECARLGIIFEKEDGGTV